MIITWKPTTETRYEEMMGVLPPAAYADNGFLVGEPDDYRNGLPTFAAFKVQDGHYYEADHALTFPEFKRETENAVYCYES
jgi:hypothetical protein